MSLILIEFFNFDALGLMFYDDVAAAQFDFHDVLDGLADVESLVVGCRCQSLLSQSCRPTLLFLALLDVFLDVLL